jgi:hypothetical protein
LTLGAKCLIGLKEALTDKYLNGQVGFINKTNLSVYLMVNFWLFQGIALLEIHNTMPFP